MNLNLSFRLRWDETEDDNKKKLKWKKTNPKLRVPSTTVMRMLAGDNDNNYLMMVAKFDGTVDRDGMMALVSVDNLGFQQL